MADPIRDFALDSSGDMATDGGDLSTVAGRAAVRQAIQIRVKVILEEIVFDQSIGVDYINAVFVKNADPLVVREAIRDRILSVPDVVACTAANLTLDRAARTAAIKYTFRDVYSTSPVTDAVTLELP